MAKKYKNYENVTEYLKFSTEQTISNIFEITKESILLGNRELHIVMLYLYYGKIAEVLDEEIIKILFEKLEQYISDGFMEANEHAKIYPNLFLEKGDKRLAFYKKQQEVFLQLFDISVHFLMDTYVILFYL